MAELAISRGCRFNSEIRRFPISSPFLSSKSLVKFQVKHQNRKLTITNSSYDCLRNLAVIKKKYPILLPTIYVVKRHYDFYKNNPTSVLRILMFLNATTMFIYLWNSRHALLEVMIVAVQNKVLETVASAVTEVIVQKILAVSFTYGLLAMGWFSLKDKVITTVDAKDLKGKIQKLDLFGASIVSDDGEAVHVPYGKFDGKIENASKRESFKFRDDLVVRMEDSDPIEKEIKEIFKRHHNIKEGKVYLKGINSEKMTSVLYLSFVVETSDEEVYLSEKAMLLKEVSRVLKRFSNAHEDLKAVKNLK